MRQDLVRPILSKLLLATTLFGFHAVPPTHAGLCQSIAIPAYFYPGPLWTTARLGAPRIGTMIMNPASGVGSQPDANYVAAVKAAQVAGIKVLGYVATAYGNVALRPLAGILAEIDLYKQWYAVDGIFLDETASALADLPYYRAIARHIRSASGGFVMLNPGVFPDQGYVKLADTTVVFENTYASYTAAWTAPTWLYKYPAGKFTHLVHATPGTTAMADALRLSAARNAGNIYVTDDVLPNPWDTLPGYWAALLAAMTANCRSAP